MTDEHRVAWADRAAYLSVLVDLKRAVDRECDSVQIGAGGTVQFGALLAEVLSARERYRWRVGQMGRQDLRRQDHPHQSPMPPDPRPPRQRRS